MDDDDITIRPAEPGELAAVAGLRWHWVLENGSAPAAVDRNAFVHHFVEWAEQNSSSHRCMVIVDGDGHILGMAWLAVVHRVPTPHALHRASGDLQCVYVVPQARDAGLGGRLITETLARAKDLGLERVTVHSSPRALHPSASSARGLPTLARGSRTRRACSRPASRGLCRIPEAGCLWLSASGTGGVRRTWRRRDGGVRP